MKFPTVYAVLELRFENFFILIITIILFISSIVVHNGYEEVRPLLNKIIHQWAEVLMLKVLKRK